MGTMNSWFGNWVDPTSAGSRTGGASTPGDPSYNPAASSASTDGTYNQPSQNTSSLLGGNANNNPRNPGSAPSGGSTAWNSPTNSAPASQIGWQSPIFGGTPAAPLQPGSGSQGAAGSTTAMFGNTGLQPGKGTPGTAGSTTPIFGSGDSTQPATPGVPSVGSTTPPSAIPTANPYGNSPFAANPGFTGPNGPGGYNPQTFATQSTAQQIASQYGGTVISNPSAGLLGAPSSPFQTNQPQYMIQMPNGTIIDPAKIASLYANAGPGGLTAYDQAQVQDVLNGSTGTALDAFRGVNQAFPTGTPIQTNGGVQANTGGYAVSPTVAQQLAQQAASPAPSVSRALSSDLLLNPFNVGTQYPTSSPYGGNTEGQVPGSTAPAAHAAQQGNNLDPNTLQQVLQFLSAYSGLGSGAGNPQGVNQSGPIGEDVGQILSALLGNGDLYSRKKTSQVP